MAPAVDVLKVVEAYVNEKNYTVWGDISTNLSDIGVLLQNTDSYDHYMAFNRKLFKPVADSLGWDAKPDESRYILCYI